MAGLGLGVGVGSPAYPPPLEASAPPSLAPLAFYDISDLSSLSLNADGTGAVAADGDPVGRLADQSGNGHHLSALNSAARPVYRTDGARHWIEPDGISDLLRVAMPAIGQDFTFVVAARLLGGSSSIAALARNASSTHYSVAWLNTTRGVGGWSRSIEANDDSSKVEVGTAVLGQDYVWAFQQNSASQVLAQSGSDVAQSTAKAIVTLAAGDWLSIGGVADSSPVFSECRIYGVQVYDRFLNDAERAQALADVQERAGL